jgi:methylglutaconyl-CoA hydratase
MDYRFVSVRRTASVVYVTLNRPEVRNAFNGDVIAELTHWASAARADPTIRVAVLSGAGKVFCAGADVDWLLATVDYTREQYLDDARTLHAMLSAIDNLPCAVIARVHGAAIAGGVGLTAVCDVGIAADDAIFAISETRIGLVPAVISPFVLAKIGRSAARDRFVTGMRFSADEARQMGLVHAVGPLQELDARVDRYVAEILNAGPEAVATAKALIRKVAGLTPEEAEPITAEVIADRRMSEEGRLGMKAFLSRERPPWASGS